MITQYYLPPSGQENALVGKSGWSGRSEKALLSTACLEAHTDEGRWEWGRQHLLEPVVPLSHVRARVCTTGASRPQLEHVKGMLPKNGCGPNGSTPCQKLELMWAQSSQGNYRLSKSPEGG